MKIKTNPQDVLDVFNELGLIINVETGGFIPHNTDILLKKSPSSLEITHKDGSAISFFDEKIFLKSLKETEASFKIKLFCD